ISRQPAPLRHLHLLLGNADRDHPTVALDERVALTLAKQLGGVLHQQRKCLLRLRLAEGLDHVRQLVMRRDHRAPPFLPLPFLALLSAALARGNTSRLTLSAFARRWAFESSGSRAPCS